MYKRARITGTIPKIHHLGTQLVYLLMYLKRNETTLTSKIHDWVHAHVPILVSERRRNNTLR